RRGRRPCRSRSPTRARAARPNWRARTGSCYRRYRREGSYPSRLPPIDNHLLANGLPRRQAAFAVFPCCSCSIRPRQAENMLGEVGQDQIGRDRRGLIEPRLAELALDVELLGKAEAAVGLQAHVGRRPGGIGGKELGHVGFGTALAPGLIEG